MEFIHVEDFGAIGDGQTPDAEAIQNAINQAILVNKPLCFGARTYALDRELIISDYITIYGSSKTGNRSAENPIFKGVTEFIAVDRMRSCLALTSGRAHKISNIRFNSNFLADYGILQMGSSHSEFDHIAVYGARRDGVHLTQVDDNGDNVINDNNVWKVLDCRNNGQLYATPQMVEEYFPSGSTITVNKKQLVPLETATVTYVHGIRRLRFSNVNLELIGLRTGDPIAIRQAVDSEGDEGAGYSIHHLVVHEVLSSTDVTVSESLNFSQSEMQFAIGIGDGYHEERYADNNIHTFYNGLFRSNAGYAMAFDGLYGPTVINPQIDHHPFWGIRFGRFGGVVIGARIMGGYFEALGCKPFLFLSTNNIGVYNPMDREWENDPVDYGGGPQYNVNGIYINATGIRPVSQMENHLPSRLLTNGEITGELTLRDVIVQRPDDLAHETLDPKSALILYSTEQGNITLTGSPVFVHQGKMGKILVFVNMGPYTVTMLDSSESPNSGLKLRDPAVTLRPNDSIILLCLGTHWIELSSTNTV